MKKGIVILLLGLYTFIGVVVTPMAVGWLTSYDFDVRQFIYDKYKINDVFVKDFNVSKFGLIYRKEE